MNKITVWFLIGALCLGLCACTAESEDMKVRITEPPVESVCTPEVTEFPAEPDSVSQTCTVEITAENLWDFYDLVTVKDEAPLTDADGNVVVRKIHYDLVLNPQYQIADVESSHVQVTVTGTTVTKYGIHFAYDSETCEYTMDPVETDQWKAEPFEATLDDSGTGVMEGSPLWLRTHFYTGEDYFCGINDVTEIEEIQDLSPARAEGVLVLTAW